MMMMVRLNDTVGKRQISIIIFICLHYYNKHMKINIILMKVNSNSQSKSTIVRI